VTLMPSVDKLMDTLSMGMDEIDAFAVCVGPGSFTGIRIGVAAAEAFAYAENKPVYAVSTLDAILANSGGGGTRCAIMDARRGEVYASAKDGDKTVVPECAAPLDDVLDMLDGCGHVFFAGDAVFKYREYISKIRQGSFFAEGNNIMQRASSACMCVYGGGAEMVMHDGLKPRYLRVSQAERMKSKEYGK